MRMEGGGACVRAQQQRDKVVEQRPPDSYRTQDCFFSSSVVPSRKSVTFSFEGPNKTVLPPSILPSLPPATPRTLTACPASRPVSRQT